MSIQEGTVSSPRHIPLLTSIVPVYKRISGILGNSMGFAFVIERCQPVENSGAHKHEPETGSVVPQRREVLELVLSDAVLFQVQDGREEGIFVCGDCKTQKTPESRHAI